MTKKILSDEAIDTFEDDLLNRKSFVENFSYSLLSGNDKKSLVIVLFGKWGSGKTSIINLLEKQLTSEKEKKSSKDKKKSPIIINFNSWGYSETEDLLEPFIRQIQATLKGPDKIKGFGKKLELYLNLIKLTPTKQSMLSFWSAITMVLSFVGISLPQLLPNLCKEIKDTAKWVSPITLIVSFIIIVCNIVLSVIKIRNENLDESVSKIKTDIGNILEKENRKLIIIMDDIDRLSSQEIKQLFRIVRSNADFPNTIYLLSFDREIVEKSLDIQNRIDGREYLEKIINIEYDLPSIPLSTLSRILMDELKNIAQNFTEDQNSIFGIENTKWAYVYNSIVSNLTTIRELKRYVNAVKFKLSQYINKGVLEINLIDFLAIEFIRLKFPEYYDFIRENKLWFITSKESLEYKLPNKKEKYDKWFAESFKESYTENDKDCLDCILAQIFPAIRYCSKDVSSILAPSSSYINDKYCSIASEKYFDVYFNHVPGIPKNDCSNYDVQLIKSLSDNYEELIKTFRQYIKDGKILSLLQLLESNSLSGSFIEEKNFIPYFSALFDITEELPDGNDFWNLGSDTTVYRIWYFLIKEKSKEENSKLLKTLITCSKDIYMFISILYNNKRHLEKQEIQQMIITQDSYNELNDMLLIKIQDNKETLISRKFYTQICYYWNSKNEESFQKYAGEKIKSDDDFLDVIDSMIYNIRSATESQVFKNTRFNYDALKLFCDLEVAKNRIESIINVNKELYKSHKKGCDFFIRFYDYRDNDFIPPIIE